MASPPVSCTISSSSILNQTCTALCCRFHALERSKYALRLQESNTLDTFKRRLKTHLTSLNYPQRITTFIRPATSRAPDSTRSVDHCARYKFYWLIDWLRDATHEFCDRVLSLCIDFACRPQSSLYMDWRFSPWFGALSQPGLCSQQSLLACAYDACQPNGPVCSFTACSICHPALWVHNIRTYTRIPSALWSCDCMWLVLHTTFFPCRWASHYQRCAATHEGLTG